MPIKSKIIIYEAQWNGEDFAYGLSRDQVLKTLNTSFAYECRSESEYAKGLEWAYANSFNIGWRIVKKYVDTFKIGFKYLKNGTSHLVWRCPKCDNFYSDDYSGPLHLPVLFMCGCDSSTKFLLGSFLEK